MLVVVLLVVVALLTILVVALRMRGNSDVALPEPGVQDEGVRILEPVQPEEDARYTPSPVQIVKTVGGWVTLNRATRRVVARERRRAAKRERRLARLRAAS